MMYIYNEGDASRQWFTHANMSKVGMDFVDQASKRYLEQLMKIGVLDEDWEGSVDNNVTTPAHKNFAQVLAEEGTVLLKNENQTLPLPQNMVKSKILVIGSKNNTFNPVTSAPANSGKVEASFIVPPAWVLSDRLGVPRIENTPGPSMSCNETNGNCLIYGGHKLNQLEEVNRTDYDTVIVFLSQVSAEENDR